MSAIIVRVKRILIGQNSSSTYEWLDNFEFKGADKDPWVHLFVPHGSKTIHQHILSPHYEGTLIVRDFTALHTALFDTPIDFYDRKAIDSTNTKWRVGYFVAEFVMQDGSEITVTFQDFRVSNITIDEIKLGVETKFAIKFTCDLVVYG